MRVVVTKKNPYNLDTSRNNVAKFQLRRVDSFRVVNFQSWSTIHRTVHLTDAVYKSVTRQPHAVCDYWVRSASLHWPDSQVASGFFSSAQTPWKVWPAPCSFAFVAQRGQSVQLSLFSHNLTSPDCSSQLEIHQGALDVRWSSSPPLHKICAPSVRNARNSQFK